MKVDVKSLEVKVDQKVTMVTQRGEPRHNTLPAAPELTLCRAQHRIQALETSVVYRIQCSIPHMARSTGHCQK